jgi:predicted dienelactone hydrolase
MSPHFKASPVRQSVDVDQRCVLSAAKMLGARKIAIVRLFAVALVVAVVGPKPAWCRCPGASTRHTADFAARGPHGVGFHTLQFVDATRPTPPNGTFVGAASRTLDTQVWYPAAMGSATGAILDAPLDAGGGPYPLILYGHALMDNRVGEAYLAEHLASRGYVVAAVDFPLAKFGAPGGSTPEDLASQPGDLRVVLDHLLAGDGGLAGAIDPERVGASGLSLGAATVLLLTYHRDFLDPRIRAVLPIAPAFGCAFTRAFYRDVRVPLLVLQGDADRLAPLDDNARRVVRRARGPRTLAVLDGASHLGFLAIAGALGTPANIDQFGCNALGSAAFPPLLGGADAGVVSDACARPCEPPLPTPTLDFGRQHDLTRIVAAAFFDAYLGGDQSAACWLAHGLAAENPDVQTARIRRRER